MWIPGVAMTATRGDIETRTEIVRLVDSFYAAVRSDDLLGPIFDDVAQTDWAVHLPKMYDFWQTVLFGCSAFRGNPLAVHLDLAARVPLTRQQFDRWLALFESQVDALFQGPVADAAKLSATRIAAVMHHHVAARAGSVAASA
jgi:hemoglobin